MNMFKIALAIFVIVAGIAGSILIVKDSGKISEEKSAGKLENQKKAEILSTGEKPIQWIAEKQERKEIGLKENYKKSEDNSVNSSKNFTETVARSIFSGMRRLDQENKSPFDYFDPSNPSGKNSKKAVESAISSLENPLSFLEVSINDGELNISADNSKEAKIRYLETIKKIIAENADEFYLNPLIALEKITLSNDISGVNHLEEIYSRLSSDFSNVSTPSDFAELHKKYILFSKKTSAVYQNIAGFYDDPIKSYLAAQVLPEMIKTEAEIKKEYIQKEKEIRS